MESTDTKFVPGNAVLTIDMTFIIDEFSKAVDRVSPFKFDWMKFNDFPAVLGCSSTASPRLHPIPAPPRIIRPAPVHAHGKLKHTVFKASCKRGTKGM